MSFPPVVIAIDGTELKGWTEMTLRRSKKDMTGTLSVQVFFTYMPKSPVMVNVTRGKGVTVYIAGQLAFTGKLDKRNGTGAVHGSEGTDDNAHGADSSSSVSIGANEYTVTLSARGVTKYIIDSSHQHPTTNIKKTTNKRAIEEIVKPWNVALDWQAKVIDLPKVILRDGARAAEEVQRIGTENAHFIYETRDGKLRVTDGTVGSGEDLILGQNILTFSAEQSEEDAKSEVKVKGQRVTREVWGKDAIIPTEKKAKDSWVGSNIPLTIQHYGDATPEALERRAKFETDTRSSESKRLTIAVFHVQSTSGAPWDIGQTHYCEVPPEGIADVFECTDLEYSVKNDKEIKTTLTLSPPPGKTGGGGGSGGGFASSIVNAAGDALTRRSGPAKERITYIPGNYPSPWSSPDLSFGLIEEVVVDAVSAITDSLKPSENQSPPMMLPSSWNTTK